MGTRPFDDEDDPTPRAMPQRKPGPPTKPGTGPVKPPAPPEPSGPTRLSWGHAGNVNLPGELSDQTGRSGVIRIVGTGIKYKAPPFDRYVWQASLDQPGRFEMPWSEGDPGSVLALADLGAELRRNSPPPANRLELLDATVQTLLHLTQILHDHDRRLGLLHPGNVLLVPGSDSGEVVLPDVGFIWKGQHGEPPWEDNPARPNWLDKDTSRNKNALYWDEEPVWQQFSWATDDQPLVPPESDLRTLARMFAATLTGHAARTPSAPSGASNCWSVLRAVIKGEITNASEFQAKLVESPLSDHWLALQRAAQAAIPAPKKSKTPVLLLLVFGLLLCGGPLGVVGYLYQTGQLGKPDTAPTSSAVAVNTTSAPKSTTGVAPTKPQTTGLKRVETDWKKKPTAKLPAMSELEALLKEFEATQDPKKRIELLEKMYTLYSRAEESDQNAYRPWIEYSRGVFVSDWVGRYRIADDELRKFTSRQAAALKVAELNQELTGLRSKFEPISPSLNERETQCLEVSGLRATELGSRRSP